MILGVSISVAGLYSNILIHRLVCHYKFGKWQLYSAKLRTLPPQLLYSFQYRDTPTIKAPLASYVPANTSTVCKLVARVFFLPICVCVLTSKSCCRSNSRSSVEAEFEDIAFFRSQRNTCLFWNPSGVVSVRLSRRLRFISTPEAR